MFDVTPDLTCLGKIIGGGLPVGAYGGRADAMELVAPAGPVYQAGTLSGNPVAMTAGLWALERLTPKLYKDLGASRIDARGGTGRRGAGGRRAAAGQCVRLAGDAVLHASAVRDYDSALATDTSAYATFFTAMLKRGVYPPPSQFEAWFLSAAHSDRHISKTIEAARSAMKEVARSTT